MKNNISLMGFATFGNPNGFTQSFFLGATFKNIKTFDIRKYVPVAKDQPLYSIRKEYVDGQRLIAYAVYTFAHEPHSTRDGSSIGSSILFENEIADEGLTIRLLNEFHDDLVSKNVENNKIKVHHSDELKVNQPQDFDKLHYHLRKMDDLDFSRTTDAQLLVYCRTNPENLRETFKKAIDLLNEYDAIFFTESSESIQYVKERGLISTIDEVSFESQYQKVIEDRKQRRQQFVDQFSKDLMKLDEERKRTLQNFQMQIDKNKRTHEVNEQIIKASENKVIKIDDYYDSMKNCIETLSNKLQTKELTLVDVEHQYNWYKQEFYRNVNTLKVPDQLHSFSAPAPNTNIGRTEYQPNPNSFNERGVGIASDKNTKFQPDMNKVALLILILALIGSWGYFLGFYDTNKVTNSNKTNIELINK